MKNNLYIYLISALFIFSSCDDYLDVAPKKSSDVTPKTTSDVELILAGAYRNDEISSQKIWYSDDVDPRVEIHNKNNFFYNIQDIQAATWETEASSKNYKDYFWMYRYQNIFRSNMAINILDESNLISEKDKKRLYAQAYFKRAYNYFLVTNLYCLPYKESNLSELGVVLKKETSFSENVKRASLEDTYKFIEDDLKKCFELDVKLTSTIGFNSPYRVTNAAVYAFAARFYLTMHNYDKAYEYSKKAIELYGVDNLKDLNTLGYSAESPEAGSINIDGTEVTYELNYPATYNNWNPMFWTETYFNANLGTGFGGPEPWRIPSQALLDTYDIDGAKEDDMRYKQYMVEHYSYKMGLGMDLPGCLAKNTVDLTVAEMLLIKAECEARKFTWSDAMTTLATLRAKRIAPSGNINLTASDKDDAIKKVIEERRREMPIFSRWDDIRRYNSNDYAADDITITRKFYGYTTSSISKGEVKTYTLNKDDRRYAAPLPHSEIISSNGVIEQNKY